MTELFKLLTSYHPKEAPQAALQQEFLSFASEAPLCLSRQCKSAHFTASGFVLNKDKTKLLLLFHRKLQRWLQPGGHADGNPDLLEVARNEVIEETGISSLQLLSHTPIDLDKHLIPARAQDPDHWHYDVRFLFHATEDQEPRTCSENLAVKWIELQEIETFPTDESVRRVSRHLLSSYIKPNNTIKSNS